VSSEVSQPLARPRGGGGDVRRGARGSGPLEPIAFLGATLIGIARLLRRRGAADRAGFLRALQHYGVESLPIVGLISFAGGAILTLLGMKELGKVGVDSLGPRVVGIVLLREIAPLIVGIALAGRVSSSCAAETALGRAGDAVTPRRRAGQEAMDLLVAPRVLALLFAGPLLVAYADGLALLGSTAWAKYSLGRPGWPHLLEVWSGLTLKHAIAALSKGAGFGLVVGLAGCYQGLRAGKGDVGARVRSAVAKAVIAVGLTETLLIFVFKWIRF
jgi:phospholipid/cholesterol/gamma-HCH transport system permease protein